MENHFSRSVLRIKFLITFFQKWYKNTRKKIVEVKVSGIPVKEEADIPISHPHKASGSTNTI